MESNTVRVQIPVVPDGADVHKSWRRVVEGLDEQADGARAVLGPEVGHGAVVETAPGALLLVLDQHITGWAEPYYGAKPYPLTDAALTLYLVQVDGTLKSLWFRHFKTFKGAFGAAGRGQIRKRLETFPPPAGVEVRVIDPGPGRPNFNAGPCRWCTEHISEGAGVLNGRGPDATVEHRTACPARPAAPGSHCELCGGSVALGTAQLVVVREGEGRREVRHTGSCAAHPSYEEYEEQQARWRATEDQWRADEAAADKKRAVKREAAAEKRRVAREAKEAAEREAAAAMQARVESLKVVEVTGRQKLFDKGLNPYGERMRLVEVSAVLEDGEPACWWEVTAYGGRMEGDVDDRGGRFFRLPDARAEYQWHKYEPEQYRPRARPRVGDVPCPADGARHCDNCATTEAAGGWMSANLGLSCPDCYDAMADSRGAHAALHH